MKKPKIIITLIFIVVIVFIFVRIKGVKSRKPVPSISEIQKAEGIPVKTLKAARGRLQPTISESGTVQGWKEVAIMSDLTERIIAVNADVGDLVQKGQLLIQLKRDEMKTQVNQVEAAYQAVLDSASEIKANLKNIKSRYRRMKKLFEEEVITKQEWENVQTELEVVEAQRQRIDSQTQQAKANLDYARSQLSNSSIHSPIGGYVTFRRCEPGEFATRPMGMESDILMRIVNIERVDIETEISEENITHIYPGQKVAVKVDALRGKEYVGKVTKINKAADPDTHTFRVKVRLNNPEGELKPGMFSRLSFLLKSQEGIIVPREALVSREGTDYVFIAENARAKLRQVEIGLILDSRVLIAKGLSEGEDFIISGQTSLKNGDKITIKEL
ncbi:MAG: efflux RND transporter periplasmic adaptor subunit [Candidatus Omnitrophica bacterium]|nr:efflux RND transporter periplasmic adaptor subunit [Candidatus Omnitrophota bacterium]